ncbi:MAG: CvpA family protein [Lachnospiraceae bacterium]|nr:CvpA family protein [Lachnospiraceae bacterium]
MYYIALIIIALIFIWRVTAGFRKGMVQEIVSLIAMAVAGVCIFLILGAVGNYLNHEIGKMVQIIVVLFVVCLVYRLVHILFTSLKLISKLPVIKGVDKLLEALIGCAEAALIVGVLVYLLKNWGLSFLA